MKDYPSIPRDFREFDAYVFDKLDGSSMRSEWSKKSGWYKHGRRKGLLDDSNPHLAQVPTLFERLLAEPLAKIATDNKWRHMVVFYEFWGSKSVAGLHVDGDPKTLSLFDVAADKKGILPPKEFIKHFEGKVQTAEFLGRYRWNRSFIEKVRNNEIEGITFEGVVGKGGTKTNNIVRAKAKTQTWLDCVREIHGKNAEAIINS